MDKTKPQEERAIDRLKLFVEYTKKDLKIIKGYSSFESYCGLGNGYILNSDRSGKSKGSIGSDLIARISDAFPMLNIKWLCSGKGDMIDESWKYEEKINAIKKILM